jgi:signal transduction histidine kinase
MSPGMLYRLSGIALLLGSLLTVLFVIIGQFVLGDNHINFLFAGNGLTAHSNNHFETLTGPLWLPMDLMILLGAILVVLGLPGMYAYLAPRAGRLGLVGFLLLLFAVLSFGVVEMAFCTFGLPFLALHAPQVLQQNFPALDGFAFVASLLYGTGTLLLGIAIMRAGMLPHEHAEVVGIALIVAAVCNMVHLIPIPDAMWQLVFLESIIGPLAFFYGLVTFGYVLVSLSGAGTIPNIRRPLLYGMLTASVVVSYVLVVGSFGVLVQQTRSALLLSLVVIGLIAILFQPLRDRLQRAVNRLVYGERDNPYAVLSQLGKHMEATLAPVSVLPTIVETIAKSLKLPYVAIILKQEDELTVVAAYGSQVETPLRFPLVYQAEQLGELVLSPRSPGEPLTPADQRLLQDLTPQIGVAVNAVRLTVDLQRSRERLVTTREEERRRLRRDLHDGLGPQLASQTLTLTAARKLLRDDPDAAEALLANATVHVQEAITDIRRLVYDLRPPALDDLGLIAALREQIAQYQSSGVSFTLDAPDQLPELSAAVEVACYRIIQEALTNVVRHSHARNCTIQIALNGVLILEITDEGIGLAPSYRPGVGFSSMRERAEELGGSCVIESLPAGGARVYAQLPLS